MDRSFRGPKHRPARRQAQGPADGVGSALEEVHRMRIGPLPLLVVALAAVAAQASYVIHYGGKVHYDGAKDEETIIQVWGMGPATATPAEKK